MISREEILNLANLSKLSLDESEIEAAREEMDGMINFANQINQFDLSGEEAQISTGYASALRDDEVEASFAQEKILENTINSQNGFFCVEQSR